MTAATIPKIKAADEPARMGASLDGAEVEAEAEDGVRVAELWVVVVIVLELCVLLAALLSVLLWALLSVSVLDKVAELKVVFRPAAVPVPSAPDMPVMLAVELPIIVAVTAPVADADMLPLLAEELAEPPLTEKRPE